MRLIRLATATLAVKLLILLVRVRTEVVIVRTEVVTVQTEVVTVQTEVITGQRKFRVPIEFGVRNWVELHIAIKARIREHKSILEVNWLLGLVFAGAHLIVIPFERLILIWLSLIAFMMAFEIVFMI
jgi:hypothetical protein